MANFNLELSAEEVSKLMPTGTNILVEVETSSNKTKSGIILMDRNQNIANYDYGKVLAAGPGGTFEGKEYTPICKVGDKILFNNVTGATIRVVVSEEVTKEVKIIGQNAVMAIIGE